MKGIKFPYDIDLELVKVQYKSVLSFLVFALLGLISFGQPVILADSNLKIIGLNSKYFEDQSSSLNLDQIQNKKELFSEVKKNVFSALASGSAYWFKFNVKNLSNQELWLDVSNSNLTELKYYKLDANSNVVDSSSRSCLEPQFSEAQASYTFKLFIAEKKDTNTYQYFIKARSNLPLEVPIFLGPLSEINLNRHYFEYPTLLFMGAGIGILVYNLFIFFVTRQRLYLFYSLYVFASIMLGTYLSNFPIVTSFLGPVIGHNYLDVWFWTTFGLTALFVDSYFDLKNNGPNFRKLLFTEVLVFVGIGILNLFIPVYKMANFYQVVVMIFYITCFVLGYVMLYRRNPRAKLFCIGWTVVMLAGVYYPLVYNGILPFNVFSKNSLYLGGFIELMVFSMALGSIINDLKNKQEKLNLKLIKNNSELEELNSSLDSFNYHVSHDLKTVLNNTKGLVSMADKYNSIGDNSKVEEIIRKLTRVVDNGTETVQSFLSLGTVDNIFKKEITDPINIEEYVFNTLAINDLDSEIKVDIIKNEIGLLPIHGKAFESILLNFYTNTIKYNDNFPEAMIGFVLQKDFYVIHYKDNGIGIDMEENGELLFEPFRRIRNKKKAEGSGVGLFLIKRIVQNYKGTISLQSEIGKGVLFEIKFPRNS